MSFEDALYAETVNTAGIAALIGTRFYPAGDVPDADKPYATYQLISTERHAHQGGVCLVEARYQINCVADQDTEAPWDEVHNLAAQVVTKYGSFRDVTMGAAGNTYACRLAYVEDEDDIVVAPLDASRRGPAVRRLDIVFFYDA